MVFGKVLKEKRKQIGWTQEELSEKIQISRPTISNWESDKSLPDILNILKLSVLFGCSLDDLLKEEIKMTTKIFKTMTYGDMPLKIRINEESFFAKGVEVKANVNTETGEVTFFIEQEKLNKLNETH
ncbi:helix-turn-helix domain-containing protein [Enterococcus sp. LJL99]